MEKSDWIHQISIMQYRKIRDCRIETLIIACDKIAPELCKYWKTSSHKEKQKLVSKYLINELYKYSRVLCKYKNDSKCVNKLFTRNFFFLEGQIISEGFGRNFRIPLPAKPFLRLYSQTKDLLSFIVESDKQLSKKIQARKLRNNKFRIVK